MFKKGMHALITAMVIFHSQGAVANNFESFIKEPVKKQVALQSKMVNLKQFNFVKNTWLLDDQENASVNAFIIEANSNIRCFYQLSQQSSEKGGTLLRFSAKLSMPLNKKGNPKKPSDLEYCQNIVTIENISLYAIHKNIMGIEVNFSDTDHYQAVSKWIR